MAEENMATLQASKVELRRIMKTSLKLISCKEIIQQSNIVHHRLMSLPEYQSARNIAIYLSMPSSELSTKAIVDSALQEGKKVFVPYINKGQSLASNKGLSMMNMVSLHSKSDYDSLEADKWGIPTPAKASITHRESCLEEEVQDAEGRTKRSELDMIIMPGVAFDRDRRRLGHGKGYYDVFLSRYNAQRQNAMPYLVGLALQQQVLGVGRNIPTTAQDWQVNALIAGDGSMIK